MTEAEDLYLGETTEKGLSNGTLRLALIVLAAVALTAVIGLLWLVFTSRQNHAYVVRIEPEGRTEPVAEGFNYKSQPQEIRWFVQRFCNQYFSRDRLTIQALPETLFYFAPSVRGEIASAWKDARVIENVVSSQMQVEAVATSVQLSRDGTEAYVQVRLDKIVNGQKQDNPQKASTYIRFECLACDGKAVPNTISGTNPLGFRILNVPLLEAVK